MRKNKFEDLTFPQYIRNKKHLAWQKFALMLIAGIMSINGVLFITINQYIASGLFYFMSIYILTKLVEMQH